jgi:DNA-binding transcriptional ArsR family regulator
MHAPDPRKRGEAHHRQPTGGAWSRWPNSVPACPPETTPGVVAAKQAGPIYALTVIYFGVHAYQVSVTTTIEVIAEASRRQILDELRRGEQPVNTIVERLAMSQPSVSKHLRVLRQAGLVTFRPDGQRRLYSVSPEPLLELDAWLEPYRQMWRNSLDKLEAQLRETRPSARRGRS